MTILAYTIDSPGDQLVQKAYELPELLSGQVLVKVTHCGVCRSDWHFMHNDWGDSEFPLVPGHEIIGEIIECGEGVKNFTPGQRVGVGWQQGACLQCEWCCQDREEFCEALQAVCLNCRGGFADYVMVDARFIYAIPDVIGSAEAAPLLCAGLTVFHALRCFNVGSGDRVAVVGLGGLGHMAVQFAHALGAKVSVFHHQPDRKSDALALGAERFFLNTEKDQLAVNKASFDFILIATDAALDYQAYIDMLRAEGRLCFVGIPQKDIAISVFSLIIGQKSICASPLGNRKRMQEVLQFAAQNKIVPWVEVMPMSSVNEALAKMARGEAKYRIVLNNENS